MKMDIQQILENLPHRYPILLVDRVLEIEAGKRIRALKNVSVNEPFFNGHFPDRPVMPGVLMLEALAQAAALLSLRDPGHRPEDNTVYYFAGIDGARFKRPVVPGDQLLLDVEMLRMKASIWKFNAKAWSASELAVEAELMWPCASWPEASAMARRFIQPRSSIRGAAWGGRRRRPPMR